MLHELHVRDLALIEDAWLEFDGGMTVLTGETGAGKTALVGALKLLLGERADSSAVRAGADEAFVEGRFSAGDEEIVVKRRVSADGRSRCQLGGEIATVGALAHRLGALVDLHGQHEHQALLAPATHVGYLDRWAGVDATHAWRAYDAARTAFREARTRREAVESRLAEATRDADYLRFVVEEIDRIAPEPGEDDALEARLPALQHAERLAEAAAAMSRLLRDEGGALDRIAAAEDAARKVAGIDPALDAVLERLAEASVLVDEAGTASRAYRDAVEHDPAVLDGALMRLSALSGLKKKYGPGLADVLARRDDAHAALAAADESDVARAEAQEALDRAEQDWRQAADVLDAKRREAAPAFTDALGDAVQDLAMAGASFVVGFSELPFESWTVDGPHRVEFLYSPAPGQPARPLARIASGGEVSRVMLALKSVLGTADEVETLVFDEIDAGIGGSTAQAVGQRLAQLASSHQVIVVTHLAQVAAFADAHLVVVKEVADDEASTRVLKVTGQKRVAEVARMLSGKDSATSRAHASELLDAAAGVAR